MPISRKQFLRGGALAAGALALSKKASAEETPGAAKPPPPAAIHFPVLKKSEFDHAKFTATLQAKKAHKVVFQAVEPARVVPGLSSLAIHIQNLLNAGEFSLGWGKGSVGTIAVLYGPSVLFALNDAMWAKYGLGKMIKANDASGNPETKNVYYPAETGMSFEGDPGAGGNVYQDWSLEACQKRGTTFMVCHNAMAAFAAMTAMAAGAAPAAVLTDWKANMQPGMMIVPAGVIAVQAAQEAGWKILPLI